MEAKDKYESEGPNFTIDKNFRIYYNHSYDRKKNKLKNNV